jgi:DNA helicase II / ATP-dependent DNA helicase PcrA
MNLTPVQREAVTCQANVLLTACPGSGKTRAIIAKILRSIPAIRDTAHRIACITYTNAAVHEIEHRLRAFGSNGDEDYCDISTIHSFCLHNILCPFSWRLAEFPDKPVVLASDSERYGEIVDEVRDAYGLNAKSKEEFSLLSREPDGAPVVSDGGLVTAEIALDFWARLQNEGAIDFPNIVYFSYRLLADNPSIAKGLACKFRWILVDEFQDTTALQVEILALIAAENRSTFFLVGDPHQSIYSFASARPDLMYSFAEAIDAEQNFELLDNFRSSAHIVLHAELLCTRTPPMEAVGENADFEHQPQYVAAQTVFQAITEEFLPLLADHGIGNGEAAILAPSWFKLMPLGKLLREYGIPVVGPGARPYKRSRLIAPLAESICGYLQKKNPSLIAVIERDLFFLISNATGRQPYRIFSYAGRCLVCRLITIGRELREAGGGGVTWLRQAAQLYTVELITHEFLPRSCVNRLSESVADMESDMEKNGADLQNLSVEDLGLFACPDSSLKLLTMHSCKGREFDAVALIDLHERTLPSWRCDNNPDALAEARRLMYVATTRAKKVLMYITDKEKNRNQPSRFLVNVLKVC